MALSTVLPKDPSFDPTIAEAVGVRESAKDVADLGHVDGCEDVGDSVVGQDTEIIPGYVYLNAAFARTAMATTVVVLAAVGASFVVARAT